MTEIYNTDDPWRYRCPNGHTKSGWHEVQNGQKRFRCQRCAKNGNDPWFAQPKDMKEQQ